ncbi:MAG: glycosyl hydrolase-related protein, partial [Salinivenus sp.]
RPYRGIVVSHTHWDRAWYLPFQVFRHRLVRLVDRLLDLLEANPDYRAFTLDGQTVLLDDYLEVRPDQEERLRTLIDDDRLLIGPWYTLPDLFLVSGEALIRNLQIGHDRCEDFGGGLPVGYIPDPFGHIAQMPQLLRGFGLDTYLFMRGMGRKMKEDLGSVFRWRAPDGSAVRAVYQRKGYFPAAALGHPNIFGRFDGRVPKPKRARRQVRDAVEKMGPLQEQRTLLLSNGFDHMPEQPELPALLDTLNDTMEEIELEHGTLPEFVWALDAETDDQTLGTYEGDLLGNADHPILQNVYSARLYLKRQNHRAQSLLTRVAEPVSAWLDAEDISEDARPFLRQAWTTLLKNHPHDDICGCSVDAVHEDDEVRFRHVDEIGTSLLTEHLEVLQKEGGFEPPAETGDRHTDVWVFNPHPFSQTVRVEATVLIPNPDGDRNPTPSPKQLAGCAGDGTAVDVTVLDTEGDVMRCNYLEQTWGRCYEVAFEVEVPPLGYQLVHLYEEGERLSDAGPSGAGAGVPTLENEHYRVAVEDGRLRVHDKARDHTFDDALRFEYQLDAGDTYSFGPVPEHGPWWGTLVGAEPHPRRPEALRLHHELTVPAAYDRDAERPTGETTLDLTTDVWLTPHRSVGLRVQYENTARNGRLRAVLPTGTTTRTAIADGHFRLAERTKPEPLTPEDAPEWHSGYPGELTYPTQHQGDFVIVEGKEHRTWIANRGSPEYELLWPDDDTHVAVTLHRAVGMLSVEGGRIRWCQAGPSIPTPGAQCLREMEAHLAFGVGPVSRSEAVRHGRAFAHPTWARELPFLPHVESGGERPRKDSLLHLDNPAVELSALRPGDEDDTRVLRLFNRTDEEQAVTATVGLPVSEYCPTDFHETWDETAARPVENGRLTLTLASHEIQTLLLR